jgi:hypothetical protein
MLYFLPINFLLLLPISAIYKTTTISVQSLKQAIERQYAIQASNLVLLVSGGETLESANRVCSYSAGTDTNPIFMFSNSLEARNPPQPWPSIQNGNVQEFFVNNNNLL